MSSETKISNVNMHSGRDASIHVTNFTFVSSPSNDDNPSNDKAVTLEPIEKTQAEIDLYDFRDKKEKKDLSINRIRDVIKLKYSTAEEEKLLEDFIDYQLNDENVFEIWKIVECFKKNSLKNLPILYVAKNFENMIVEEKISSIENEKLKVIIDEIKTISTENLIELMKKWKEKDWKNRRETFCYFLSIFKVELLSDQFIVSNFVNELDNCTTCVKMLKEIIRLKYRKCDCSKYKPMLDLLLLQSSKIMIGVTLGEYNKYNEIQLFNLEKTSWETFMDISQLDIFGASMIFFKNSIFFIGGLNEDRTVTNNESYKIDLSTKQIIHVENMTHKRFAAGYTVFDDKIYAIGGINENKQVFKSIEFWDFSANEWRYVGNLNKNRWGHAVLSHSNKIFVMGGYDQNLSFLDTHEIFDPKTNEWKSFTVRGDIENIKILYTIKATVYRKVMYIYYPYKSSNEEEHHILSIDIITRVWNQLPDLPKPQCCRSLVTFHNKIIYFGDSNNYEYDPSTKKWNDFTYQQTSPNMSVICESFSI